MQKWEYKIDYLGCGMHYDEDKMNCAGNAGWELVGLYREDGSWYAVYKRPRNA